MNLHDYHCVYADHTLSIVSSSCPKDLRKLIMEKVDNSKFCCLCKEQKNSKALTPMKNGKYRCSVGHGCNNNHYVTVTKGIDGYCFRCDQVVCICSKGKKMKYPEQDMRHPLFENESEHDHAEADNDTPYPPGDF